MSSEEHPQTRPPLGSAPALPIGGRARTLLRRGYPSPTDSRRDLYRPIHSSELVRNRHRSPKKQREFFIGQSLHHLVRRHSRGDAARLRSAPDVPRVPIEPRGLPAGMMEHDHGVARPRHLHFDAPIRTVRAAERPDLSGHFPVSWKSTPADAVSAARRIPRRSRASTARSARPAASKRTLRDHRPLRESRRARCPCLCR